MKNTRLILLFVFSFPWMSFGQQVPNAGFENWANAKTPDNWVSGSFFSIISNQCNQNQTDKVKGNGSAEIRTEQISGAFTSWDFISLGNGNWSLSKGYTFEPVAFAFRPDSFLFFYKYTATGTDTALMKIKLTKAGTVLLEEQKSLLINNKWEQIAIHLTGLYKSSQTPDSLLIQFYSSKPRTGFFGVAGSVLKVDELRMGYKGGSSVIPAVETPICKVFPNPSDQYFLVETPNPEPGMVLTVYSGQGIEVLSQNLDEIHKEFNIRNWPIGLYYYTIKTNTTLKLKGKLSVSH